MNLKSAYCSFLLLLLALGSFAQSDQTKREKKPKPPPLTSHVVLILIDGLRLEDLNNPKANLPTLKSLRERGAAALNVESVYPSQSLPAHATIVTGMYPSDHGVTGEKPFDEKAGRTSSQKGQLAGEIKADTIWQAAERARVKTAASNFPLLETTASDAASDLFEKNQPGLLLVRLDELANSLTRFGIGSVEVAAAAQTVDNKVKQIVDAIERVGRMNETTFLIVSSHGYAKAEQEFRPNVILVRKGFLAADASGTITSWIATTRTSGGAAAIYLQDQDNEELAKELEKIFADIQKQESSPIWRVISKKDATKLGADPRAALFLEAAPGFLISEQVIGKKIVEKVSATANRSAAGYLPSRSEMRGALIAAGKGIKPNTQIEYVRLVDIAPTIARLLGLELKTSRGHAISAILTQQ